MRAWESEREQEMERTSLGYAECQRPTIIPWSFSPAREILTILYDPRGSKGFTRVLNNSNFQFHFFRSLSLFLLARTYALENPKALHSRYRNVVVLRFLLQTTEIFHEREKMFARNECDLKEKSKFQWEILKFAINKFIFGSNVLSINLKRKKKNNRRIGRGESFHICSKEKNSCRFDAIRSVNKYRGINFAFAL